MRNSSFCRVTALDKGKLQKLEVTHVVNCAQGPKYGHVNTTEEYYEVTDTNAGFRLACHSPLRLVITACHFRVAALSGHATLAFSPSLVFPMR